MRQQVYISTLKKLRKNKDFNPSPEGSAGKNLMVAFKSKSRKISNLENNMLLGRFVTLLFA
jgi:hypothetical protein